MSGPRVGIDGRLYAGNFTGIGTYTRGLVDALAALPLAGEWTLLTDRPASPPAPFGVERFGSGRRLVWTQLSLPARASSLGLDLLHATANHQVPLILKAAVVTTIHDLIPLLHPETVSRRHRAAVGLLMGPALRKSREIIVSSEWVREGLLGRYPSCRGRVTVIPDACDPVFFRPLPAEELRRARERNGLAEPFVLSVGAIEPRKNLPALVEAFARVTGGGRFPDWRLVLAGGPGWRPEGVHEAVRRSGLGDRVRMTGFVPQGDLPALYQAASLFVFPSLAEGFGLPVLEAMASGTPVLVAAPSALTEITRDAGATFDLARPGSLADRLESLMADDGERGRLAAAGRERAGAFSWGRCARETIAVYERALGRALIAP